MPVIVEDLVRLQEVIYAVRPEVIVETGVFSGRPRRCPTCPSLAAMGEGRVIGIDREIQPHIREALCSHPLASRISLLEGSSTDPAVVSQVRSLTDNAGPVLVILDSDHTREHVERELECYAPLVTKGSYIVATDGIMKDLYDVPRAQRGWKTDNRR